MYCDNGQLCVLLFISSIKIKSKLFQEIICMYLEDDILVGSPPPLKKKEEDDMIK